MNSDKFQELYASMMDWIITLIPRTILALFVLIIGLFIVKRIKRLLIKALNKSNFEAEISEFLGSTLDLVLKLSVFLIAAAIVGVKISALIGMLAALGFAVGLALQGFLGNFASGLTILFFKPYRIGDLVKISDHFGRVKTIQIFNTTLETPNDKTLVIPNGQVTDNIITNYSTKGNIKLELNVTMPYEESFPKVKEVIEKAVSKSQYIITSEPIQIGIESFDSHNIILAVRPYIDPKNYWNARFEIYAMIKQAFSENKIKAAYSEGVELGPIGS